MYLAVTHFHKKAKFPLTLMYIALISVEIVQLYSRVLETPLFSLAASKNTEQTEQKPFFFTSNRTSIIFYFRP